MDKNFIIGIVAYITFVVGTTIISICLFKLKEPDKKIAKQYEEAEKLLELIRKEKVHGMKMKYKKYWKYHDE